ncbi:MAG: quinone-dependent dihydroorotate dehydrogenase [Pelagibacteraceae bacterium]
MFSFLKPYIFSLDPEVAHDLAIKSLKINIIPKKLFQVENEDILQINLFGKKINNPIGLAAGFDKSAEVYNSLFKLGFGFVEVGTVTPKKQLGSPKPRIFRLEKDQAMINRLGFNNHGLESVLKRISSNPPSGLLGINIGPNKDTKNKIDDFKLCLSKSFSLASYITVNISSPNTEGLRNFHKSDYLNDLLKSLNELRNKENIKKPVVVKLSPDIDNSEISNIIELILKFRINGLIISNTSDKNREDLLDAKKNEKGGLSGKPIENLSTKLIKKFYTETKNKIPIIGVGGVNSGQGAFEKITTGASAVQLYTGMIYNGPGIVKKIKKELILILKKEKIKNIEEAVGINA